jgi:DNA repair exonuclease SbcCD ATPase subunit
MVTHVEEIKSAAQEVVNIERGNGVSTLSAN